MNEILIRCIDIDKAGVEVYPSRCPATGQDSDILKDLDNNPSCIYKFQVCKYFKSVSYDANNHHKTISCTFKL